jgi:hypothetical protein
MNRVETAESWIEDSEGSVMQAESKSCDPDHPKRELGLWQEIKHLLVNWIR